MLKEQNLIVSLYNKSKKKRYHIKHINDLDEPLNEKKR